MCVGARAAVQFGEKCCDTQEREKQFVNIRNFVLRQRAEWPTDRLTDYS
jgi:hypothetical protein